MSRKKVKRSNVKKTAVKVKHQVKDEVSSMERDYKEMPAKIAVQLRSDLTILKKREVKLQSLLQKMQKQQNAVKNKQSALAAKAKGKVTASSRKEIVLAKKANEMLSQAIISATRQLQQLKKQIKTLSLKQAKYAAIKKHISKLQKEWKKQAKADKPVAKSQKKSVKKPRNIRPEISEPVRSPEPMMSESTPETVEFTS